MQLSKEFECNCSGIGAIMTNPKKKSDVLSVTCLSYVHKWIKSLPEFYGRKTNFRSKYTSKGNSCETEAIKLAADYYGWGKVEKNTERKTNGYLTGEADVVLPDSIEDIKNSWSQDTFPLFHTEIPIDGYGYQGQGYLELWDKPKFGLVYALLDAPERLVMNEAWARAREMEMDDLEADLYDEVKAEMTYSNIKIDLRIKRFALDRDKESIVPVYERIDLIRQYIKNL